MVIVYICIDLMHFICCKIWQKSKSLNKTTTPSLYGQDCEDTVLQEHSYNWFQFKKLIHQKFSMYQLHPQVSFPNGLDNLGGH